MKKQIVNTFKDIKRNKGHLLLNVLIDVFFLVSLGFIAGILLSRIEDSIFLIFKKEPLGFLKFGFNLLLLAISIFLAYSLFQGASWLISYKISGEKIGVVDFFSKFAKQSALYLAFTYLAIVMFYVANFFSYQRTGNIDFSIDFSNPANILLFAFFAIIGYFALINHSSIAKTAKESFSIGLKNFRFLFPIFLVLLAILLALNYLVFLSSGINKWLMFVLGILIIMPLFSFARIFFIKLLRKQNAA